MRECQQKQLRKGLDGASIVSSAGKFDEDNLDGQVRRLHEVLHSLGTREFDESRRPSLGSGARDRRQRECPAPEAGMSAPIDAVAARSVQVDAAAMQVLLRMKHYAGLFQTITLISGRASGWNGVFAWP
jgi:hypothetical protein